MMVPVLKGLGIGRVGSVGKVGSLGKIGFLGKLGFIGFFGFFGLGIIAILILAAIFYFLFLKGNNW